MGLVPVSRSNEKQCTGNYFFSIDSGVKLIFVFALILSPSLAHSDEQDPKPAVAADPAAEKQSLTSQSLLGTIVPKGVQWAPPTGQQRWNVLKTKAFVGPGAYFRAFGAAAGDQNSNRPRDWGQGGGAYAKRVANRWAVFTLQDSAEAGLSAVAGYETRYVRCNCEGGLKRMGHALQFNFVTFDSKGHKVPNWPKFVSAYGVGMLSTTWTPNSKWSAEGLNRGNSQIYFGVFFNIIREFSPDIAKAFKRR